MTHCVITLYRLSTLEDPDWDRGLVKETVNLSLVLAQLIERMKQVKTAAELDVGVSENLDIFNATAQRLQTIKDWWDARSAVDVLAPVADHEARDESNVSFDDAWLKDILGTEDYQFEPYMPAL